MTFRHRNHYVPQFLLKRFACPAREGFLWEYRLLVEHPQVPAWIQRPVSHIARASDLYTIAEGHEESDDVERWLDKAFEHPASAAVEAAISGRRLTKEQWLRLIHLYAAQFLRTPAYFICHKDRWAFDTNRVLREQRESLPSTLPRLRDIDGDLKIIEGSDGFPIRCTVRKLEDGRRDYHLEYVTGRKHWMWAIRKGLRPAGQITHLERHKWTIVEAPTGVTFFLTDNPALCVRRLPDGTTSSDGGWGMRGSILMLPLDPRHLLYCHVGYPTKERRIVAHQVMANQLRADLADGALRSLFCFFPDAALSHYRPRTVDRERFRDEAAQWAAFGSEQTRAERFEF